MNVSPNGYYNYKKHRKDALNKKKESILRKVATIYHEAGGRPGYRMMQKLLEAKGITLSIQTVRKYMNVELHLKSVTRKRKHRYHSSSETGIVFDNIINQNFTAKVRYTRFCTDFTYLFLADGKKRYNCTVIDLYDRAVVASVNGNRINAELAVAALSKALEKCPETTGVIIHSDRGSQYTSTAFTEFCEKNGVVQSMSKPGYPYDNAPMERYFNTLKSELINLHRYETQDELYEAIQRYEYGWYNNQRPHSFNNGLPPSKVA